ncbi:DUF2768 family protein [Salinithrix halophila]|uniref:DUF2768 family protein n=1 Tax=Salinithrix halophila TaxID=1485204 RepID=A0ABV8JMV6_9BACL
MMDSFIAIVLLLLANFTIVWTRQLSSGWIRVVLSAVAFLMLIPAFLFGLRALM